MTLMNSSIRKLVAASHTWKSQMNNALISRRLEKSLSLYITNVTGLNAFSFLWVGEEQKTTHTLTHAYMSENQPHQEKKLTHTNFDAN